MSLPHGLGYKPAPKDVRILPTNPTPQTPPGKVDVQQAILNVLQDIRDMNARPVLKRLSFLNPVQVTFGTSPVNILRGDVNLAAHKYVQSLAIKVKDMGTATAINVGTSYSQLTALLAVGDFYEIDVPPGFYIDPNEILVSANIGATSKVETSGLYYADNTVSPPVNIFKAV